MDLFSDLWWFLVKSCYSRHGFSINWCRLFPDSSTSCHWHLAPTVHNFTVSWGVLHIFHPLKGSWSSVRICETFCLLSFSSCNPRAVRPSVMPCHPLMFLTNLIALLCTASSSCIEAELAGFHRISAYSSIGRHRLEYARSLAGWDASFRACLFDDASKNFLCAVYCASYVSVKF